MSNALALLALVGALVIGALLHARWSVWRRRARWGKVRQRAAKGERDAVRVLRKAGYRVVADQESVKWPIEIDGERHTVTLRADFIVKRRRKLFVAEVKTGKTAPDPRSTATRRQLLEYLHAYDVDGVVLVDMEARTVSRVEFPGT